MKGNKAGSYSSVNKCIIFDKFFRALSDKLDLHISTLHKDVLLYSITNFSVLQKIRISTPTQKNTSVQVPAQSDLIIQGVLLRSCQYLLQNELAVPPINLTSVTEGIRVVQSDQLASKNHVIV